jgi:hypothetical protein
MDTIDHGPWCLQPLVDHTGVAECDVCEMSYAATDEQDANDHSRYCSEFLRVTRSLAYTPRPWLEREQIKSAGQEKLRTASTDAERIDGAFMLLRGWYDRSLEHAIGGAYGMLHPDFDGYVKAAADVDLLGRPAISRLLWTRYAAVVHPGGAFDDSDWIPCIDWRPDR